MRFTEAAVAASLQQAFSFQKFLGTAKRLSIPDDMVMGRAGETKLVAVARKLDKAIGYCTIGTGMFSSSKTLMAESI